MKDNGVSVLDSAEVDRLAFEELLRPLLSALRAELDYFGWQAYYRVLKDVPRPLLARAIDVALHSPLRFLPKATELLASCEDARQLEVKAIAWTACEACETSPGWAPLQQGDGVRLTRCACWKAYQARLASAGLSTALALPASLEEAN